MDALTPFMPVSSIVGAIVTVAVSLTVRIQSFSFSETKSEVFSFLATWNTFHISFGQAIRSRLSLLSCLLDALKNNN